MILDLRAPSPSPTRPEALTRWSTSTTLRAGHRLPGQGGAPGDPAGRAAGRPRRPRRGARWRAGCETLRGLLREHPNTALFVARDAAEARRFWADRKRLGAIAARTNAFKLNEDVVLPLAALAEFARCVDATNVAEERAQLRFVERAEELLRGGAAGRGRLAGRAASRRACALCAGARGARAGRRRRSCGAWPCSQELRAELAGPPARRAGAGRGARPASTPRARPAHRARHPHARRRRQRAREHARDLQRPGRCCAASTPWSTGSWSRWSGSAAWSPASTASASPSSSTWPRSGSTRWRPTGATVDPGGLMNPGQARGPGRPRPGLHPLLQPARAGGAASCSTASSSALAGPSPTASAAASASPTAASTTPARGLFFHPRNKNLAIGALDRGPALRRAARAEHRLRAAAPPGGGRRPLHHLPQVPGALPGLHRHRRGQRARARDPGRLRLQAGLAGDPRHAPLPRHPLAGRQPAPPRRPGPARRRAAAGRLRAGAAGAPRDRGGRPTRSAAPLARAGPSRPGRSARSLPGCEPEQALLLEPEGEARRTVFYFPGCGSERLHGPIGEAALHLLLRTGTRVVLPPPFLCCGFPAHANARTAVHARTALRDTILFSQIREMLGYLAFDALRGELRHLPRGAAAMGADRHLRRAGRGRRRASRWRRAAGRAGESRCSTTPLPRLARRPGREVAARPSGAASARGRRALLLRGRHPGALPPGHRRRHAGAEAARALRSPGRRRPATVLTNCPSCLQGLGRCASLGVRPRHLAVHLAERLDGPGWAERFRVPAARAQAVRY